MINQVYIYGKNILQYVFCSKFHIDLSRILIYYFPALAKSSVGIATPFEPKRPKTRTACFFVAGVCLLWWVFVWANFG